MTISRLVPLGFAALAVALIVHAAAPPSALSPPRHPLVWDAQDKRADLPGMTNIAYFTFSVTNTSAAEATILSTESSCDCTVVESKEKLPWRLAPGESGVLNVRVNTLGKYGLVEKSITVQTSHGTQTLMVHLNIPVTSAPANVSVRNQDVMAAQADRQAVFQDRCAACHARPAGGRTGESLFVAACAICHISDHRAEMVPDLAKLNHETGADYWQKIVTSGKPGSLMPAFALSEGGILDTNQIQSLVTFLVERYPSKSPVAK